VVYLLHIINFAALQFRECEVCKVAQPCAKQFKLSTAPPILTIQLKRFTSSNQKINDLVTFQEQLDLSSFGTECDYSLFAVIVCCCCCYCCFRCCCCCCCSCCCSCCFPRIMHTGFFYSSLSFFLKNRITMARCSEDTIYHTRLWMDYGISVMMNWLCR
jgi:hypothetical protein